MKVKLDPGAYMPERAHRYDAGLDIRAREGKIVPAHGSAIFDTGVHVAIPERYVGMLKSKSGLNVKHGITSEGVIDAHYTGSIVAKLYNHSDVDYEVRKGDKITQLVIQRVALFDVELVCALDDSERGDNGFGSTGR